jgi:hypothetical protein|tara:strand:- start:54 stop:206 length:153 start_codon:yes stop_codon:yes gene_type:complete
MKLTSEEIDMILDCLTQRAESMRFYGSSAEYKESKKYFDLIQKVAKLKEQ